MTGETIWNAPLWFVPVFFYCNSLFILISHSLSEKQLSLYMPILAAFSFIAAYIFSIMKPAWVIFGVDRVLHMFGYFCIGMMAKPIKKTIEQFSHKQTIIYSIICLLLFLLVSILSSIKNVGNNISILNADYNDFPFYAFIAVISVFTFVFFCSFFPANKLIRLIAENTMFIMCTHYFCRDVWFSVAKRTLLYDLIGGMLTLCVYVAFLYALRRFIVPKLSEKGKFFLRILGIEMGYSDIESLRTPKSDVYDPVQPVESN